MKVSNPNDVKVYNVSAGKSMPEWLSDRKRRNLLKNDIDLQRRIQLIQDFEMPVASSRIKASSDGRYVMATGVYPPRIRCFELAELCMKFERYLTCDIVQFEILSEDFTKLAFLTADRHLEVHAQYGSHYKTRIPRFGRDMLYQQSSCELIAVGDSDEIYRLNLEQGRFMQPWKSEIAENGGLNTLALSSAHELLAVGSIDGRLECWDPRSKARVGAIDIASTLLQGSSIEGDKIVPEVTSIKFDADGLSLAVGTSSGHVLLYDIRSDQPLVVKDHQYGFPIKSIQFHGTNRVISADTKIVKIWERNNGNTYTSIETENDINDMLVFPDSGLIALASEAKKIQNYFIPSLGPAPKWCAFLENLTEELEESTQPVVYDDYKFVTKKELEALGLGHLIGTNLLRAYMHGFFMDVRLYHKAKAIAEPFAYEEYRKNRIKEKIDSERANRIRVQRRLPKVNKGFAESIISTKTDGVTPINDDRFSALFKDPKFEIDVASEQYKLLHPARKNPSEMRSIFNEIKDASDDDEDSEAEGRPSEDESDDEKYFRAGRSDDDDDDVEERESSHASKNKGKNVNKGQDKDVQPAVNGKKKFFEIKDSAASNRPIVNLSEATSKLNRRRLNASFEDRVTSETVDTVTATRAPVGPMEMTFVREKKKSSQIAANNNNESMAAVKNTDPRDRRGVRELRLKKQNGPVFWRGQRIR